jgi:hypothetical protein
MAAAGFAVATVSGNKLEPSARGHTQSNRKVEPPRRYAHAEFIDHEDEDEEDEEDEDEEEEEDEYQDREGSGNDDDEISGAAGGIGAY